VIQYITGLVSQWVILCVGAGGRTSRQNKQRLKGLLVMSVGLTARRTSSSLLRAGLEERSTSCPDLKLTLGHNLRKPPVRHLNLMLLHPRGPKIRHLNASHTLLMEMEKHVQKVQDLEKKVLELEKRLQMKDLMKTQSMDVGGQAWEGRQQSIRLNNLATTAKVSEEAKIAFAIRLGEARAKVKLLSAKREEEEANILR